MDPSAPSTRTTVITPGTPPADGGTVVQITPPHAPPRPHDPTLPHVPGFEVRAEVARGGMGVVYLAHDPTFGRDVAVKVMHDGQNAERFVVEARVTAVLVHPGVPPVHALGTVADGRPFLAMKFVTGRTLADELRGPRGADLTWALGAFERVCQTVGFAHARGIVHRDLKPANVMVGEFGEVQVMDWGLARAFGGSPRVAGEADGTEPAPPAVAGAPSAETSAGAVVGTPAYMAPEQARGEPVGARADVFALGGILAVALTGRPPFVGRGVSDTVARAARGELAECFAALDACAAEPELCALARRCLSADPAERYADGAAVAGAVAEYRAGVRERLRRAERDRAAAEARALEEANTRREAEARALEQRNKRRAQVGFLAALALLVAAVGAFALWQQAQESDRRAERARLEGERDTEARTKAEQARAGARASIKLAVELRPQFKFKEARAALGQARPLATAGAPELLADVERAERELALAETLDGIRSRKWAWLPAADGGGEFDTRRAPGEYRRALAEFGTDPLALDPDEVARRIASTGARSELLAALDDWALYEPDTAHRDRLLEVARRADPNPWTDRLRDPRAWIDPVALERLRGDLDMDRVPAARVVVLAELLRRNSVDPAALLTQAHARFPEEFELAAALGRRKLADATGHASGPLQAARSLRPENRVTWLNLGAALAREGDIDGAVAITRQLIARDDTDYEAHTNLGYCFTMKGDLAAAEAELRRAVELAPENALPLMNLGSVYARRGEFEKAVAHFRLAIERNERSAGAHSGLGAALTKLGAYDEAIRACERAIALNPDLEAARLNLGMAHMSNRDHPKAVTVLRAAVARWPNSAQALTRLGVAELRADNREAAIVACLRATRADPTYAPAYAHLGNALADAERYGEAVAACARAVELDPKFPDTYFAMGMAFEGLKQPDKALDAYRLAVRYDRTHAAAYTNLGALLLEKGQTDEALAAYRAAVNASPTFAKAHLGLGGILFDEKRYREAVEPLRAAVKYDPTSATGHGFLGLALKFQGDLVGAREHLGIAAQLDKKTWGAQFALVPKPQVAPEPRAK